MSELQCGAIYSFRWQGEEYTYIMAIDYNKKTLNDYRRRQRTIKITLQRAQLILIEDLKYLLFQSDWQLKDIEK